MGGSPRPSRASVANSSCVFSLVRLRVRPSVVFVFLVVLRSRSPCLHSLGFSAPPLLAHPSLPVPVLPLPFPFNKARGSIRGWSGTGGKDAGDLLQTRANCHIHSNPDELILGVQQFYRRPLTS
jgi:hypothetical protein